MTVRTIGFAAAALLLNCATAAAGAASGDGFHRAAVAAPAPAGIEKVLFGRGRGGAPANPIRVGHASTPLRETYWKLIQLAGAPVEAPEHQREPHLVLAPDENRASGSGGCNAVGGGFTLDGDSLHFSQMMSTMMACPKAMKQERHFLDALAKVAHFRIEGDTLDLLDASGAPLMRFSAVAQH